MCYVSLFVSIYVVLCYLFVKQHRKPGCTVLGVDQTLEDHITMLHRPERSTDLAVAALGNHLALRETGLVVKVGDHAQ